MDEDWVDVVPDRTVKPKVHRHRQTADEVKLYDSILATSEARLKAGDPIFRLADKPDLFAVFLNALPEPDRQKWRCTACRSFVNRAGSWVLVDVKTGDLVPFAWDPARLAPTSPLREPVNAVVAALADAQADKRVDTPLKRSALGRRETGGFRHMHVSAGSSTKQPQRSKAFALTPAAELADMLERILEDNDAETVEEAASLILKDKLPFAAEHKGAMRWLRTLYTEHSVTRAAPGTRRRRNLALHHASAAFTGCIKQLRSGALSTLLEGVRARNTFTQLESAWRALVNPQAYMRPTAAPTEGQVAAAERLFSEMGLTREDLRHRFSSLRDIPADATLWRAPAQPRTPVGGTGVFSNVATQPRKQPPPPEVRNAPATHITFARLVSEILPHARSLEVNLPHTVALFFLVTGLPGSAPLMPWHTRAEQGSWYTHGSATALPARGLKPGWTAARAVLPLPHLWRDTAAALAAGETAVPLAQARHARHGMRYVVALRGAAETRARTDGVLFPSLLRGELHGVRRVVEGFNASTAVEGPEVPGDFVGGVHVGEAGLGQGNGQFEVRVDGRDVYKIVLFA